MLRIERRTAWIGAEFPTMSQIFSRFVQVTVIAKSLSVDVRLLAAVTQGDDVIQLRRQPRPANQQTPHAKRIRPEVHIPNTLKPSASYPLSDFGSVHEKTATLDVVLGRRSQHQEIRPEEE